MAGNVLGLQSSSGALVNTYTYSPFGETTSVRAGVANRFRFASGEQTLHAALSADLVSPL